MRQRWPRRLWSSRALSVAWRSRCLDWRTYRGCTCLTHRSGHRSFRHGRSRRNARFGRLHHGWRRSMLGDRGRWLAHWQRGLHRRSGTFQDRRRLQWLRRGIRLHGRRLLYRGGCLNLRNDLRFSRPRRPGRLRRRCVRRCLRCRIDTSCSIGAVDAFSFGFRGTRARSATPRWRGDLDCFLNGQEIFLQMDATSSGKHRIARRLRRWGITSCEDHSVLLRIAGSARTRRQVWGSATQRPALQNVRVIRVAEGVAISAPGVAVPSVTCSGNGVNTTST